MGIAEQYFNRKARANTFYASLPFDFDPKEGDITVEYKIIPKEPSTSDYPGAPATVEILSIIKQDTGMMLHEVTLPEDFVAALKDKAIEDSQNTEDWGRSIQENEL